MQVVEVTTFMEIPDDWTSLNLSNLLDIHMKQMEVETDVKVTWQFIVPVSKGKDDE